MYPALPRQGAPHAGLPLDHNGTPLDHGRLPLDHNGTPLDHYDDYARHHDYESRNPESSRSEGYARHLTHASRSEGSRPRHVPRDLPRHVPRDLPHHVPRDPRQFSSQARTAYDSRHHRARSVDTTPLVQDAASPLLCPPPLRETPQGTPPPPPRQEAPPLVWPHGGRANPSGVNAWNTPHTYCGPQPHLHPGSPPLDPRRAPRAPDQSDLIARIDLIQSNFTALLGTFQTFISNQSVTRPLSTSTGSPGPLGPPTAALSALAALPPAQVGSSPAAALPLATQPSRAPTPRPHAAPPSPLPHDASLRTFKSWREQWNDYYLVAHLHLLSLDAQLATLRSSMTSKMRSILHYSLGIDPSSAISVSQVLNILLNYFRTQLNAAVRKACFTSAKQETGEPFDDFFVRLKEMAEDTDLCHCDCNRTSTRCADSWIRNQIATGIVEDFLRQQLLALPDSATLREVVQMCQSREKALASDSAKAPSARQTSSYRRAQRPSGPQSPSPSPSVTPTAPPAPTPPRPQDPTPRSPRPPDLTPRSCVHCDKVHILGLAYCSNANTKCPTCNRKGHLAPQCVAVNLRYPPRPYRPRSAALSSELEPPRDSTHGSLPPSRPLQEYASTSALAASIGTCPPAPRIRVTFRAHKAAHVSCIPDTGSDVTLIDAAHLPHLGLCRSDLATPPGPVYQPDGSPLRNMLGTLEIILNLGNFETTTTVYFLSNLAANLLSWSACRDLGIIPKNFPDQIQVNAAVSQRDMKTLPVVPLPATTGPLNSVVPLPATAGPLNSPDPTPHTVLPGHISPRQRHALGPARLTGPPTVSLASLPALPGPTLASPPRDLPQDSSPIVAKAWFMEKFQDVLVSKNQFLEGAPLQTMSGPPMRIFLKKEAQPFAIFTPRQVPLALQEGTRLEIEALLRQGIIVPAGDTPSQWCHPMVVVPKPKGGVRITVDLSKLNDQVNRPTHPSPTPFEAIRAIPAGTCYFTTLDALCGYWQIPLQEEDSHLTTFITPYGRYRYTRGPMGFSATGDEFCRRGDLALAGISHCQKVVDDILLWDSSYAHHIARVYQVLVRCRSHGITINADKFIVARPESTFCGYRLSTHGVAADPDKVKAIADFPVPVNITDVRSFMGLTNQLAGFSTEVAALAAPLRPLLRPAYQFMWTVDHQLAFQNVKNALLSTPILQFFHPRRPTRLQTDASRLHGLGYALLQQDESEVWRLVQCGSRFLADVESRYSTIELELLAVVWAMRKCSYFLLGRTFSLVTDHRPLLPILDRYTLDQISNPRLQRLREKIAAFTFSTTWLKGSLLCVPDALSRAPVSRPTIDDLALCQDLSACVRAVSATVPSLLPSSAGPQDLFLDHLRSEACLDIPYQTLSRLIVGGFPTMKDKIPIEIRSFWSRREDLSVDDGLILLGSRIVIPTQCRRDVLSRLHAAHRGVEATKLRARSTVWWPAIDSDIKSTVLACEPCQSLLPRQQKEPLLQTPPSSRPFEDVSADFCQVASQHWLIYHDRYSGWVEAIHFGRDTPASKTVSVMAMLFSQLGVPLSLRTDNGPQFSANVFTSFLKRWNVRHETSSPHYPQSNGHAEAGVKKFKLLALKVSPSGLPSEDLSRALLELRNTPSSHGLSPAQLAWGRPLRSCIPVHYSALCPTTPEAVELSVASQATHREQLRVAYDATSQPLPPLQVDDAVRILSPGSQRWDTKARVVDTRPLRSILVARSDTGQQFWRNRKHVRLDTSVPPPLGSSMEAHSSLNSPITPVTSTTRVQPVRACKDTRT